MTALSLHNAQRVAYDGTGATSGDVAHKSRSRVLPPRGSSELQCRRAIRRSRRPDANRVRSTSVMFDRSNPEDFQVERATDQNNTSPFERIKRTDARGEHWSARELQPLMGYTNWRQFSEVIDRAKLAARNTGADLTSLFEVDLKKSSGRPAEDYRLARYAAYLVAMNGDPRKPDVAAAQTYFAVRTHEAEVQQHQRQNLPAWAVSLHALVDQQAAIEMEQQHQARRLQEVAARVEAIEGAHDWFAALAYARLNGLPTERGYLQRVGMRAGRILRKDGGMEPGYTQHPAYGRVNTYPVWVLERAVAEVEVRGAA